MEVFKTQEVDMVLDVGANLGQFAKSLRQDGYTGIIHSFEPVKDTFRQLAEASKDDDKWFVHNFALGEAQGSATINVMNSSAFASVLKPNDFGTKQFEHRNNVNYEEEIKIETVDNFLASLDTKGKNIFLKMDTQGLDLKVFAGAKASLAEVVGLVSELSIVPIYEGMPSYLESLKVYSDSGFALTALYPVSRVKEDLTLIEIDCVMINKQRQ